jgi:hypothetical protein
MSYNVGVLISRWSVTVYRIQKVLALAVLRNCLSPAGLDHDIPASSELRAVGRGGGRCFVCFTTRWLGQSPLAAGARRHGLLRDDGMDGLGGTYGRRRVCEFDVFDEQSPCKATHQPTCTSRSFRRSLTSFASWESTWPSSWAMLEFWSPLLHASTSCLQQLASMLFILFDYTIFKKDA